MAAPAPTQVVHVRVVAGHLKFESGVVQLQEVDLSGFAVSGAAPRNFTGTLLTEQLLNTLQFAVLKLHVSTQHWGKKVVHVVHSK